MLSSILSNKQRIRNAGVKSDQLQRVLRGQFKQVAVRHRLRFLYEGWQLRHSDIVGNKAKRQVRRTLKRRKGVFSRSNIGLQPRYYRNSDKSELGYRAGMKAGCRLDRRQIPIHRLRVQGVTCVRQRNQRVNIKEVFHGKSTRAE